MIPRPQTGTQRPPPPQRVSSTASHRPLNRPALPSKLSNVSSASQHERAARQLLRPQGAQPSPSQPLPKQESTAAVVKHEVIDLDMDDDTDVALEAQPLGLSIKPQSANSLLADGQSPRPWDGAAFPPMTPPQPPITKQQSLPLPTRPSFLADTAKRSSRPSSASKAVRRDPSRRSNGLRPPAIATTLPRGKVADFFPWTGGAGAHSEDLMNENTIRSGNNDKGAGPGCPLPAAESNTARPNLWPQLQSKQGLQVLSNLFCQVLEKRQQLGRCTAPSTFKPPPRVTLTDTKREAWLKDLANPNVPLRRLSRTIPHGIRGKALLEHCISKDIPITRAVWLSKCVGANEIRAFKRKGVSGPSALAGEVKWIRDWTTCVEDFVDGVIGDCGQNGWSRKMNYAIRLATYFFSEHLLDSEHFMDWLLSMLESSNLERLPIWVLLTQVYWKHMTSRRKLGRRLSEALVSHIQTLLQAGHPLSGPLMTRLQQLVFILAIAHQGCLIMPKSWNTYEETFNSVAYLGRFAHAKDAIQNVRKRNLRVMGGQVRAQSAGSLAKQILIDALDQAGFDGRVPPQALPSGGSMDQAQKILPTVLEWASSLHRHGMARIYLSARILRHWNITGADTDTVILEFLESAAVDVSVDAKALHDVVALLARSNHFSTGKYLQWLISTGALSGIPANASDAQLLLNLPTGQLQPHVFNLRRTVLHRMGYNIQSEQNAIAEWRTYLSSLLKTSTSQRPTLQQFAPSPPVPSGAVRCSVAQWLCEEFAGQRNIDYSRDGGEMMSIGRLHGFCVVRETLERFGDFLRLFVVLKAVAGSAVETQFLATIADTINMRADVFAAMGVLDELVRCVCNQQLELRRRLPLEKCFLLALSSLVQRVPCADIVRQSINADLQYCENQTSASACSPASDSMVVTGGGLPESDEDVDRVLTSGNTMDEHLFTRMFGVISDKAMKAGLPSVDRTGAWFAQLRRFDPSTFDQLLHTLINRLKEPSFPVPTFVEVTAALVGSGCMKISLPFQIIGRHIDLAQGTAVATRYAQMLLELVLPHKLGKALAHGPEVYKFMLEQKIFLESHTDEVLRVLLLTLSSSSELPIAPDYTVDERAITFLRYHVNKPDGISSDTLLDKDVAPSGGMQIQRLLDHLMDPTDMHSDTIMTPVVRVQRILGSANEISFRSCKLALQYCCTSASLSDEDRVSLLHVFQDAIERDSPVWPEILNALDDQLVQFIYTWARNKAIALLSDFVSSTDSTVKTADIRRYLCAAEVASSPSTNQACQPQTFVLLNEHLASLTKLVDSIDPLDVAQAPKRQRVAFGIDVLLQITVRQYSSTVDNISASPEITALASTICLLLIQQKLQNQRGILEYLLDVASIIVDDLSSETMGTIVRNMPAYARVDPRVKYLFGITFSPDSWLALASKVYNQPAQTAAGVQQAQSSIPSSLPRPSHPLPPRPGSAAPSRTPSTSSNANANLSLSQQQAQSQRQPTPLQRGNYEIKYNPFQLRRWEIMPDPTPNMGANDTSLSLGLFQARKVT